MKKPNPSILQQIALAPMVNAMNRAIEDETLLLRIYTAMGPYSFSGKPQDPKEWEACLSALRDRFDFDDSE